MIRTGLGRLSRRKASRGKATVLATQTESHEAQTAFHDAMSQLINEGAQAQEARDWARAAAYYTQALAMVAEAPSDGDKFVTSRQRAMTLVQLGHVLREQGDTAGAEKAFREAIDVDAALDEAHYFLGLLMQRWSRRAEAAPTYFKGLQLTGSPLLRRGLEELDYSPAEIDGAVAQGGLPDARVIPDDPDFPPNPVQGLPEKVKSLNWFHSINLGEGIVTPGVKTRYEISREADALFAKVSVRGRSVVDIGAWNGGFTVEAKRRGAGSMLAIDTDAWASPASRGKESFELVMSRLGIEVETKHLDIQSASVAAIGHWQVVLFLGVLYHLFNPIAALRCLSDITDEVLVLETHLELQNLTTPAMAFYPGSELNGDPTNWWAPNRAAVEALLKSVGFPKVLFTPHPAGPNVRGIFHAFKSEAICHNHMAIALADVQ
jgi:tRNA (mo5U34)-methyltransferase